jgi:beta-1,4-mannosyl-glycoprotein beta-1,4-N-acetylglucosaminyltransferase
LIFDCFLYFNERELLELHLATVGPFVDRFVICESNTTFRGQQREYAFPALGGLPFAEKIHYVPCDMSRHELGPWGREAYLRNAAETYLAEHAGPEDWVLVGDVDEIPAPAFLQNPREGALEMRITQGWLNWFATYKSRGTVVFQRKHMISPAHTRDMRTGVDAIPDSGWHLTYTGGVEAIQQKLRSFSHTEYSVPPYTDREYIEARMNAGVGFFNAPEPRTFFPAPIEELPPYVAEHRERFEHLLRECR